MTTVAAVVVTFNRRALLVECLEALDNQTLPLNHIFLIDNASTDGTEDYLRSAGYLDRSNLTYVRMDTNVGGSGGFSEGLQLAHAAGFDWIWIMDDDAEPLPSAFEVLATHIASGAAAICPVVVMPDGSIDTKHRGMVRSYLSRTFVTPISDAPHLQNVEFCSFVGLAVSSKTIDKIGFPKKEFFLHYDDNEYSDRILKVGAILMDPASKIIHKEAGGTGAPPLKRWATNRPRTAYDKLWIKYFGYRNRAWLRINRHPLLGRIYVTASFLKMICGVIIYDSRKFARIRFWTGAFFDAMTDNFDNGKPRRILD